MRHKQKRWQEEVHRNPVGFYARQSLAAVADARGKIAKFLGQEADQIVLVRNTTEAATTTMRGFPFKSGDEVIVLDHEYGAITYAVKRGLEPAGGKVVELPVTRLTPDEEVVKIIKAESTSIYKDYKRKGVEYYFPDRILSGGDKFWCSEGGHEFFEDIKFYITFDKSFRLNAIWIHWAFAPGEYKISYSNDETKTDTTVFDLITNGNQQSVKNADLNWWKSVLSNSKTRWIVRRRWG